MATKRNSVGRDIKNEAEQLVIELEKEMSTLDECNEDGLKPKSSDDTETQPLDKSAELCANNNEEQCNSMDIQGVTNKISNLSENENHDEKQSSIQSTESDSKMKTSKFDDYFSDVDVEYL